MLAANLTSPWDASYTYTPLATPVKAAHYSYVHLTSYNGHRDDLSSWWMRRCTFTYAIERCF